MKKIYSIAALAASLSLVAVSCQVDNMDYPASEEASSALTISPSVSDVLTSEITRGELINWDKEAHANIDFPTDKTFFVTAVDGTGTFIPAWREVKYMSAPLDGSGLPRNMWKPIDENDKIIEYNWKPNDTKTFYAYAFLPEGSGSDITGTSSGMSMHYTVPTEASAQQDLLFGFYQGIGDSKNDGKTDGTASLLFHHALTSVVVKLGTVEGSATFKVTGLSLEGVYASGTGVLTPESAAETEPGDRVSWTADKTDDEPNTTTVSQSVTWSETSPISQGDAIGEPFIVIPQTFGTSSKARLKVSIEIDGRPVDIYQPLRDVIWKAGEVNIYTVDYNGHEGVQLWEDGPYWATKNVGAEKPEDYGWYFSWGNVKGYIYKNHTATDDDDIYDAEFYTAEGGILWGAGFSSTSHEAPGNNLKDNITVNPVNDAAQAHMGVKWRMPTKEECEGLIANTVMTYTTCNGVKGFLFTGTQTGYTRRSIFIPASGFAQGGQVTFITKAACLRTSTWSGGITGAGYSLTLGFNSAGASPSLQEDSSYQGVGIDVNNYGGRVVRAVENTD